MSKRFKNGTCAGYPTFVSLRKRRYNAKLKARIEEDRKDEEKAREKGIPRKKEHYRNSISEQSFAQFANQFNFLRITKRGYPDFTIMNEKNEIIGFVEVKASYNQKLKFEQEIFQKFCFKHKIPFMVWRGKQSNKQFYHLFGIALDKSS